MLATHLVLSMFSVAMMVLATGVVCGQDYPNKPIRVVTTPAGSGNDFTARLIAQGISGPLGRPLIVDNRPQGVIPGEIVSRAPPDGYTLLVTGGTFWIGSLLQKTPYDPVKDFAPITMTDRSPAVLVVHPSVPAKSVKELIALAKDRPGKLNYASAATGSTPHLAAELFNSMAGVVIVRVPYSAFGVGITDLIAGQPQLAFSGPGLVVPHIKAGRLRPLAVTSAQPSVLLPGLPTVAATGLPGYETVQFSGVFAPTKTPVTIINFLNQEIVRVLNQPDVKEKFFNSVSEAVGSSPEEFAAAIASDMARMGKVIKDAGIRAE